MGTVMLTCPQTGEPVSTGLETDAATFANLPRSETLMMPCPACGGRTPRRKLGWTTERLVIRVTLSLS
jgi:hypothetical protein